MAGLLECRASFTVGGEHVAEHLAARGVRVLSTPCLILFMERVARECLDRALPEGYTSVGVRVDVRHRRPVPEGGVVEVRVRGLEDEGGYYLFSVRAYYNGELVAEGVHVRKAVEASSFAGRAGGRG